MKKKMAYADKINVPFAVIIGDDEVNADKLTVKNLETGEQTLCTLEEAVNLINK